MSTLAGKVVCITGASRGLGAAMARAFAAEGASLVLGARTLHELEALAATLPTQVVVLQTDVRRAADCVALVAAAVERFGRLDVMVNNAGLAIYGDVLSITDAQLELMLSTNVGGVVFGSQAALRVMKAQGSGLIINVSSIAGKLHLPNESAYNASKWAVNGFTGTLRLEAEPHGVKVTCLCPGGIDTPFWEGMATFPFPTDRIQPKRDFMRPEEVASTVVHICQGSERYVLPEVVMLPVIRPA